MGSDKVRIGIIGSKFQAEIHAASIRAGCHGEVVAVASPTPGDPEALASKFEIPNVYHDYKHMLEDPSIEMVTIAAPNSLHCEMTVNAAAAGKHVLCEKPLAMTIEEADLMVKACDEAGVFLFFGEELFFTPKYVKAKEMAGGMVATKSGIMLGLGEKDEEIAQAMDDLRAADVTVDFYRDDSHGGPYSLRETIVLD